jgi:dihydroneopterin aldolase
VPRLLLLEPDFLGFRGALCGVGGRTASIDPASVQEIRDLIPRRKGSGPANGADYELLAARGYAHDLIGDPSLTDRIFVHDLVLPVRIGAYAHERAAPQRVRFNVDALVIRGPRQAQDMRDVFSYDIISDGIRLLVAAGHVPLVETLAERIAAMALAHPRVVKVTVKLEKLETGSGIVGVIIERTRTAAVAYGHALPMEVRVPGVGPQP